MSMSVAYIVGSYPFINITFIHREIVSMRRQGVEIDIVSMRRPKEGYILEEARQEMETVFYVHPVRWPVLALANLFYILTRPYVYVDSLVHLLTRPHDTWSRWLKTWGHFALGVYVAWHLRRRKPDHIHAHFADRATVVAYVSARLLDLKHSFTAHAVDIYADGVFLADKIKAAEFATTCTRYNWEHLVSLSDEPDKIHCLYHGLDFARFADLDRGCSTQDPPLILAIGQLKEKKGFPYLIEACAKLRDSGQDFRCWIIGEGPDRGDLTAQIQELELADRVHLKGNVPFAQVLDAFAQASVFTLPCVIAADNDRDGIPNVILEAMAAGVPVISTSISGIPEVVIHDETGYLVHSRNSQELADGLAWLLNAPQERTRLAQKAKAFVHERFSLDRNVEGLKLLFERHVLEAGLAQESAGSATAE